MKYYPSVEKIEDIPADTHFFAVLDDSLSYMGADYGPPNPPPSMDTINILRVIPFSSKEELDDWVSDKINDRFTKGYKIFSVKPMLVKVTTYYVVQ
jgi:hypothetical protein